MDERCWAKNRKNGSECTGALGKCARTKMHWRTWEVRQYIFDLAHLPSAPRSKITCWSGLVKSWLARSVFGRFSEPCLVTRARCQLLVGLSFKRTAIIEPSFIDGLNQLPNSIKRT